MIQIQHGTATITVMPGTAGVNDGGSSTANYAFGDVAMATIAALGAVGMPVSDFCQLLINIDQERKP